MTVSGAPVPPKSMNTNPVPSPPQREVSNLPPPMATANPQGAAAIASGAPPAIIQTLTLSSIEKEAISQQLSSVFSEKRTEPAYFMTEIDALASNPKLSESVQQAFHEIKQNFEHISDLFNGRTTNEIESSGALKAMVPHLLTGIHNLFQMIGQLDDLPDDLTTSYKNIAIYAKVAKERFAEGPPKDANMLTYIKNNKSFFYEVPTLEGDEPVRFQKEDRLCAVPVFAHVEQHMFAPGLQTDGVSGQLEPTRLSRQLNEVAESIREITHDDVIKMNPNQLKVKLQAQINQQAEIEQKVSSEESKELLQVLKSNTQKLAKHLGAKKILSKAFFKLRDALSNKRDAIKIIKAGFISSRELRLQPEAYGITEIDAKKLIKETTEEANAKLKNAEKTNDLGNLIHYVENGFITQFAYRNKFDEIDASGLKEAQKEYEALQVEAGSAASSQPVGASHEGIRNLGATCYANSAVQLLRAMPIGRLGTAHEYLQKIKNNGDRSKVTINYQGQQRDILLPPLTKEIRDKTIDHWIALLNPGSTATADNQAEHLSAIIAEFPGIFSTTQQCDSGAFIQMAFQNLFFPDKNQFLQNGSTGFDKELAFTFGFGIEKSTVQVLQGDGTPLKDYDKNKVESTRVELVFTPVVPPGTDSDLQSVELDENNRLREMGEYQGLDQHKQIKTITIERDPNGLILKDIARTTFNVQSGHPERVNKPEVVDINQVRAVIFHSGSARYGHYTSLRKINDDEYLYISDSNVRRLNSTQAQKILTNNARNIKMTLLDAGGSTTTAETAEDGTGAATTSSTSVEPDTAQSTSTVSGETQQQSVFNPPKVVVTKVVEKNNDYSAIFRSSKNKNTEPMASANAGDTGLYVGGAGINAQFASEVKGVGFKAFHKALIASDKRPTKPDSVEHYHHVAPSNGFKSPEGHIIISGFKDEKCPHGNPANRAMVYIVPPKSSSFKKHKKFYEAVQQVSKNTIKAISEYNSKVAEDKKIKTFRPVAFSSNSGSYVGTADPQTVKQHILAGIQAGLSEYTSSGITKIELPNAFDDA